MIHRNTPKKQNRKYVQYDSIQKQVKNKVLFTNAYIDNNTIKDRQ